MTSGQQGGAAADFSLKSELFDRLLARAMPDLLYHFTSSSGLIGIAADQALFSTHIAYMNDTGERLYGMKLIAEVVSAFRDRRAANIHEKEFLDQLRKKVAIRAGQRTFVTSFAEAQTLAMYRMYCPPNDGICLGIPGPRLLKTCTDQGFALRPCIYKQKEQWQIAEELISSVFLGFKQKRQEREDMAGRGESVPRGPGFFFTRDLNKFVSEVLETCVPLFKHPSFESEGEWRLTKTVSAGMAIKPLFRSGMRGVTPYIRFELFPSAALYPADPDNHHNRLRVVVGSSDTDEGLRRDAVRMLFESFEPIDIETYHTTYRA